MATELPESRLTQTVDLTGLPERVTQSVRQLVTALREEHAGHGTVPPPAEGSEAARQEFSVPLLISRPRISVEEFEQVLDELSSGLPGKVLPPDFSRSDIYDDHD